MGCGASSGGGSVAGKHSTPAAAALTPQEIEERRAAKKLLAPRMEALRRHIADSYIGHRDGQGNVRFVSTKQMQECHDAPVPDGAIGVNLCDLGIDDGGIGVLIGLLRGPVAPKLVSLNLEDNKLTEQGIARMASELLPQCSQLIWLGLAGNPVPEERQKKCVATVNLGSGGDEVKRPLWAGTAANRAMLGNARLSQAPES